MSFSNRYKLPYLFLFLFGLLFSPLVLAQPACPSTSGSSSSKWAGGEKNLQGHYLKHQSENSTWDSTTAYTDSAVAAMQSSARHTIANGPNAGRVMYFGTDSGAGNGVFVVTTGDGKIISAFKPKAGKRYFDRQVNNDNSTSGGPGSSASTRSAGEDDDDIWTIYTHYQCNPHDEFK